MDQITAEPRTPMGDTLGDYLKELEAVETSRRPSRGQAAYVRIDGNRFSKFTRGMDRPFDARMSRAMIETTRDLVREFGAAIGYTQSDEISLVLIGQSEKSEIAHGGKFQKLASRTASKATACFFRHATANGLADFVERQFPEFDSRAFGLSVEDAAKAILWRELDARKNAIQMTAQHNFPHKLLQGKHGDQQLEMLRSAHVDFEAFPAFFTRGTFIKRVRVVRDLTPEELAQIPAQYRPAGPIERTDLVSLDLPTLRGMEDRADVLFQ
jgi:tRNA(His) guanylyltransferase